MTRRPRTGRGQRARALVYARHADAASRGLAGRPQPDPNRAQADAIQLFSVIQAVVSAQVAARPVYVWRLHAVNPEPSALLRPGGPQEHRWCVFHA
jgi:hypothetical protein